jgi:hypothetical protein
MVNQENTQNTEQRESAAGVLVLTLDREKGIFRMTADNLNLEEMASLTKLANDNFNEALIEKRTQQRISELQQEQTKKRSKKAT